MSTSTEQTRRTLHRFQAEVEKLYMDRLQELPRVSEALETAVQGVQEAVDGAIDSHESIVGEDVDNRIRLSQGEIDDATYSLHELVVHYLASAWLNGAKSVLHLIDQFRLPTERVEHLRSLVNEMEASLKGGDESERPMGDAASAAVQEALEEYRRGETQPFL